MSKKKSVLDLFQRFIEAQQHFMSLKAPWYRMRFKKSLHPRNIISEYEPHQGKQECARRVRQMAKGML
jgi:hypothetical protein